jgi:hypothetical protein
LANSNNTRASGTISTYFLLLSVLIVHNARPSVFIVVLENVGTGTGMNNATSQQIFVETTNNKKQILKTIIIIKTITTMTTSNHHSLPTGHHQKDTF